MLKIIKLGRDCNLLPINLNIIVLIKRIKEDSRITHYLYQNKAANSIDANL